MLIITIKLFSLAHYIWVIFKDLCVVSTQCSCAASPTIVWVVRNCWFIQVWLFVLTGLQLPNPATPLRYQDSDTQSIVTILGCCCLPRRQISVSLKMSSCFSEMGALDTGCIPQLQAVQPNSDFPCSDYFI